MPNEKVHTGSMKSLAELLRGIRPESDFTASHDFMADGMLDSFDMITLVATLDERFRISISGVDIVPGNFRNLETIAALLLRYGVAP
jgi:acyl carrier protein